MATDLQQQFDTMVERVRSGKGVDIKPTSTQKLAIYALYKQATEGDVTGEAPAIVNLIEYAKYMAWQKLTGMDKTKAMQEYINYFSG